jgi:PhnB protein
MKSISPYLYFSGNCREAMNFYKKCLGGELTVMTFEGSPVTVAQKDKDKVMHSSLTLNGQTVLMASDCVDVKSDDKGAQNQSCGQLASGGVFGDIAISVDCVDETDIRRNFEAMSEGATVTMPLDDQFWGALFGTLTDKYGVKWMFNYDRPEKVQQKQEANKTCA